jgi:membrane protein DedA with SNARE-associated domain
MAKPTAEDKPGAETDSTVTLEAPEKSSRRTLMLGIAGVTLTVLMVAAIIYYNDKLHQLQELGYIGAFIISILGGATVIVPVPMLPVVFALGGTMGNLWQVCLLGLAAAGGEVIGGLTIYFSGQGTGQVINVNKSGRVQKAYERMLRFVERRGILALFLVTFIVNPFFYPAAFACGALRMGLKKFVPVIIVGKLIKCMTVVYAGYYGLSWLFRLFGINT